MKPELNFNTQDSDTLRRVLSLLRKIRAAIEVEPNYICNEAHWIGRRSDTVAMNTLVLWIAIQLEADVTFIDGEFRCDNTLGAYLSKTYGAKYYCVKYSKPGNLGQLMRMAWCDKMIEDLEQKCVELGIELT